MPRTFATTPRAALASLFMMVSWIFLLQACGGGGGGGGGGAPPAPAPYTVVTTLAGTAGSPGSVDATGAAARFVLPNGVTTDGTNLYVADTGNNTVRQIVIATGVVTTLAGTAGSPGSADGIGAAARFNNLFGITTDNTNLYVADGSNHTIRKIVIASGVVTTLAGTAGQAGSADGTGATARFNGPLGITTDNTSLYVVDNGNHTIRQIVIATGVVTTLAGTAGSPGFVDNTGAAARFNSPWGITTDNTNLYVSDSNNHTLRRIVIATGAVTTLAGTAGVSGSADDVGAAARFNFPRGITTDNTNLYVSDSSNHTLRRIVIASGVVTTLAGTASVSGSADGTGAAARFNGPRGIIHAGQRLFVGDAGNHTLRVVQ